MDLRPARVANHERLLEIAVKRKIISLIVFLSDSAVVLEGILEAETCLHSAAEILLL